MQRVETAAVLLFLVFAAGCIQGTGGEGKRAEALFCPQDKCAQRLAQEFGEAGESIHVAVYSFTHPLLGEALAEARGRGVAVMVAMDAGQAQSRFSLDENLLESGVAVRLVEKGRGLMHHKFAVVDGETVATGSFNYSKNADYYNNENILVLESRETAERYEEEFQVLWEAS